jgi:hypothetical protein
MKEKRGRLPAWELMQRMPLQRGETMKSLAQNIVYGILGALAAWGYIMLMYAAVVAFGGE